MSRRERVEDDEEEQRLTKPRRGFLRQSGRLRPRSPEVEEFQPRMRFDPIPMYPSLPRYPGSNRGNRRSATDNMDGDGFNFNPPDFSNASPDDSMLPNDPQEPPTNATNIIRSVVREKVWNSMVLYSDTRSFPGVSVTQAGSSGADADIINFTYNFHRDGVLNRDFCRSKLIKVELLQFRGDIFFQYPLSTMPVPPDYDQFLYMNGCFVTIAFVYDSFASLDFAEDGKSGVDYYDVFNSNVVDHNIPPPSLNMLAPFTFTNPLNRNRFQILFRKTYHINYPLKQHIPDLNVTGNMTGPEGVFEVDIETQPRDALRGMVPLCCNRVHIDETIAVNKTLESRITDLNVPTEYRGRIFPVMVSDYPQQPENYNVIWAPVVRWQARLTGHSLSL